MGVHFGIWHFDGEPIDPVLLARVHALLRPFASFQTQIIQRSGLALLSGYNAPSRRPVARPGHEEVPPLVLWSGRLDNRTELAAVAGGSSNSLSDEEVIQLAYRRAGTGLFARILGDWTLTVVHEAERELILARDFVGVRPLFYRVQSATVTWSSHLAPLVLLDGGIPALSEEYLAGWLSFFPESHLTPYRDILSLPPSSFVRITPAGATVRKYWTLESAKPVRHRTDREYEEHFLCTFREAVRRRINSDAPILAELSGGMDSSSIVCVADAVAAETANPARIDTVTYFDSAEPNWDELPYARKVEEQRGRTGHHIDIGPDQRLREASVLRQFQPLPTSAYSRSAAAESFDRIVSENGYRVVLSGIGGDEMLGGVPTPIPELADLLARLQLWQFLRQSFRWALAKRKPIIGLWRSALASFLPSRDQDTIGTNRNWTWLKPEFLARNREHFGFHAARFRLLAPLPSLQANAAALEVLSRQISCVSTPIVPSYEWRYPFLDRDLVTFCSSIPREQLVRPNQRRSLMRRALAGTVPREILERKRKAYVSRGLVKVLAAQWRLLRDVPFTSEGTGIVDSASLSICVERAEQGKDVPILPLLRTLALEQWLRGLRIPLVEPEILSSANGAPLPVHHRTQELLGRERPN